MSSALPSEADIVIIGGGIIGISAALALAEAGHAVTLCEKGRLGGEQSSRNWGWIRTAGRSPAEIALALASREMWRGFAGRAAFGFRESGIASLCADDGEMAAQEAWMRSVAGFGLDARLLGGEAVARLAPGAAGRWAGVLHAPTDAVADRTGGRVSGVVTEAGRIAAATVILAGGAWSRLFCGNAGVRLPQLKVLGSVCRTEPIGGLPDITVSSSGFSFRKGLDGGYVIAQRGTSVTDIVPDSFRLLRQFLPAFVRQRKQLRLRLGRRFLAEARLARRFALDAPSPFEAERVLDPQPVGDILQAAIDNLIHAFPGFAGLRLAQSWAGMIDVTPDALPVIGPVAAMPGFFLATGFSAHGFGIAPAAGRLVADLATGRTPIVDPAPFRPDRFDRPPPSRTGD
jgi:glycine/D-amino acid oxidase-like deaminating enzyme